MRIMGIDFGSKRVGVAISDEDGRLAFPTVVLKNSKTLIDEILALCSTNKIEEIVIGDSKDLSGKDNPIMEQINKFKEELRDKSKMKIHMEPEFFTSSQASRSIQTRRPESSRGGDPSPSANDKNEMLDASASAIILQSFLDRKNNGNI